jgi:hypothetical protein
MTPSTRHRFFEFELDSSTGALQRAGAGVPLERQPSVVLSTLVTHAGQAETIRPRWVWPIWMVIFKRP